MGRGHFAIPPIRQVPGPVRATSANLGQVHVGERNIGDGFSAHGSPRQALLDGFGTGGIARKVHGKNSGCPGCPFVAQPFPSGPLAPRRRLPTIGATAWRVSFTMTMTTTISSVSCGRPVHGSRCGILAGIGCHRTAQICGRTGIGVSRRRPCGIRSCHLSGAIGRRRGRRLWCGRAQRLDRSRLTPEIFGSFRCEHGCLDCTICVSRPGLRRDIARRLHQRHCRKPARQAKHRPCSVRIGPFWK